MSGQQSVARKEPDSYRSRSDVGGGRRQRTTGRTGGEPDLLNGRNADVSPHPKERSAAYDGDLPIPAANGELWPAGFSRTPKYSIGKVVELVGGEFPALTVSKLRYLEDQGIVTPQRSSSGYRKFSEADIERICYCLRTQRDSYLPIKAIVEQLQSLDAGEEIEQPQAVRLVATGGELVVDHNTDTRITIRELLDATGIEREDLDRLVSAGLLKPDLSGRFPGRAHQVVRLALTLQEVGVKPTSLRFLATAAERASDALDSAISYRLNTKTVTGKERRHAQLEESTEIATELFTQLMRISSKEIG